MGHGSGKFNFQHPQGCRLFEPDAHMIWAAVLVRLVRLAVKTRGGGRRRHRKSLTVKAPR
jgi:hypothetical protein